MDEFTRGLKDLLLKFQIADPQQNQYAILIFAVGCAVLGLIAVVADVAIYVIRGKSVLDLKHSLKTTSVWAIAWPTGAFVVGYIGQIAKIFQVTMLACVTVGFLWPILLVTVLDKLRQQKEIQKDTDVEE